MYPQIRVGKHIKRMLLVGIAKKVVQWKVFSDFPRHRMDDIVDTHVATGFWATAGNCKDEGNVYVITNELKDSNYIAIPPNFILQSGFWDGPYAGDLGPSSLCY